MAQSTVNLGTAASFAILAGSGITNTGSTTIIGDVGTFPTATETGFSTVTLIGTNHIGDFVTQVAKSNLAAAYTDVAGRAFDATVAGDIGGQTFSPGVYRSTSSLAITGTLTLDAQGDPNAIFIFQMASTLTTATNNSNVNLINGAKACNVFWQVGSSATLGTNTTFQGNILAYASITVTTGVIVTGRLLAINDAVTLDTTTITIAICETPIPQPQPQRGISLW